MRKTIILTATFFLSAAVIAANDRPTEQIDSMPYYFIAIHNEPYHGEFLPDEKIKEDFIVLKRMVSKADDYNIKLTLMLPAQWVEYIISNPERMIYLRAWRQNGHEIAACHNSIYHNKWDGYTNYPVSEAFAQRARQGERAERYLGTLHDYMNVLRKTGCNIKSGCLNDEYNKKTLPDEIIYDTCSGFANYGKPGRRKGDENPEKGRNDYISYGIHNGIGRKWLANCHIGNDNKQKEAQYVFNSMSSGVYGVFVHSFSHEEKGYLNFLEFLHSKDPEGRKSRTVAEIIEQHLLFQEIIPQEIID